MPCFYLTPKQDDLNKIPELQVFDHPCVLVVFFAGLCWDVYALRRVMDCGRLSLYSSLPELHNR